MKRSLFPENGVAWDRPGRLTALAALCTLLGAGAFATVEDARDAPPPVFTEDIAAGIEHHIEEATRRGDGYFDIDFDGQQLQLRLVKIHMEYLANLGPQRHFACVDLVDTRGDVYDVDFFLAGDPGAMSVTETTVHKINGKPYYAWKQEADGTWSRVAVEDAEGDLLGVITGEDTFDFVYRVSLPAFDSPARMWLPYPTSDAFQTVQLTKSDLPGRSQVLEESEHGNKVLVVDLDPAQSGEVVEIRYRVHRKEKAAYEDPSIDPQTYLEPDLLVPVDDRLRSIAEDVTKGKKGDLVRARAIYDHVIDSMRYAKFGDGWGKGDAMFACSMEHGNCTDYHAYFTGLARSVGIPARFAIGAALPSERNNGGVDGYHCWVEFFAEGKWWPVDISEADKYSSLATYYFGHHPANRFEFSRGRDLEVVPGPASGPINFLAYPILEVDGKPAKAKVTFTFQRRPA
jgi:transglutaminase-like putative cysteine protease